MRERTGRRRRGQRAAVNSMQQPLLGEVPQVAADGVLRDTEAGHQLRGDDPAVTLDPREDRLSTFSRQHPACSSTNMQVYAGSGTGCRPQVVTPAALRLELGPGVPEAECAVEDGSAGRRVE